MLGYNLFLLQAFLGTDKQFSEVAALSCLIPQPHPHQYPPAGHERSGCSTFSPTFSISRLLHFCCSRVCSGISLWF